MSKQNGNAAVAFIGFIIWVVIVFGSLYGWIMNIVTLIHDAQAVVPPETNLMIILRGIGIVVAPLGSILGYV